MNSKDQQALAIYEITGIDEYQLKPVIERLQGLNFMSEDLQLTESGRIAAYALNHLHGKAIACAQGATYLDNRAKGGTLKIALSKRNEQLQSMLVEYGFKEIQNKPLVFWKD
jgi:hypothetical protein